LSDGQLDRRIVVVHPIKPERLGRMERRLRHETRLRATVHLRGMHQERVAQVDGAGFASG
jgi:hypothetical protein